MHYQIVRLESKALNLVGERPYVLARTSSRRATLVERRSDGKRFLIIGATEDLHTLTIELAQIEEQLANTEN